MLTNNSSVKRLNLSTGVISDVVDSKLGLEGVAIKPDGTFVISNGLRNELSFYGVADNFINTHLGLVSPKGLLFDSTGKLLVSNSFPNSVSTINAIGDLESFSDSSDVTYMQLSDNNIQASTLNSIIELDLNGNELNSFAANTPFGLTNTLAGELVSVSFDGSVYQYALDVCS